MLIPPLYCYRYENVEFSHKEVSNQNRTYLPPYYLNFCSSCTTLSTTQTPTNKHYFRSHCHFKSDLKWNEELSEICWECSLPLLQKNIFASCKDCALGKSKFVGIASWLEMTKIKLQQPDSNAVLAILFNDNVRYSDENDFFL